MTRTISIVNYKGGVGKTAVTLNLGAALHRKGKSVLLVDLDPQAALTFAVMGRESGSVEDSVYGFLSGEGEASAVKIHEGLDLMPTTLGLETLTKKRIEDKVHLLKDLLAEIKGYDFMLVDTPPAINIFTVMAIVAANSVYTIVNADLLSYRSLLAIEDVIKGLRARVRKGIIVNLFDQRRNIEKELFAKLKADYKDVVFRSTIRRSVLVPEGVFLSRDIFSYRKKSPVAMDFEALAREVIKRESAK